MFDHFDERPASTGPLQDAVAYSSRANDRRYRRIGSHLVPRTTGGKLAAAAFLGLLALTQWPFLALANRIEPSLFGVPFLFVYLLLIYALLIAVLVLAAYAKL